MEGFNQLHDDPGKVDANSIKSHSAENKLSFRTRDDLKHLLQSNKFHIFLVTIVIIDCFLVVSELLLDLNVFTKEAHHTVAPHVLHYCSIGILGFFLIETIVRICVFRCEFFKHKFEVFDAAVVVVSFVLEVVFRNSLGPESAVGLLVVLRLWRVARIINGVVMSVKIHAENKLKRERRLREASEEELMKYREYCTAQEREIEKLRELLIKHGITDIMPMEIPRPVSLMNVEVEENPVNEKT
ncbi:hypothetical protein DPMN_009169 [Dreissena polymorpha]|uniref:Voltage-gated hydrogen channel 1 n=2 Tax=Dreissena polymorpha TaxID=45954 RepID=A0A9D4RZW5_DREPO|nr:hypothetical protein DPMN_009169 [Dreissena polymorpha]